MFAGARHGNQLELSGRNATSQRSGPVDYLFPQARQSTPTLKGTAAVDDLVDALVHYVEGESGNSQIPPVFTYFGQFVGHDIFLGGLRNDDDQSDAMRDVSDGGRRGVDSGLTNLRSGRLVLDSIYGNPELLGSSKPQDQQFLHELMHAMRSRTDSAKMRISRFSEGDNCVALPKDQAADLLRFSDLLRDGEPHVTEDSLTGLSTQLQQEFLHQDGTLNGSTAIIGDWRNDTNLIVAQLHVALLRFHNRVVDWHDATQSRHTDREAVSRWARREITNIFQWLALNEYLPTLCNPGALGWVISHEAPLFRALLDRQDGPTTGQLTMPLEFIAAVFQFSHAMLRPSYDWNSFFGRNEDGLAIKDRASLQDIFEACGSGSLVRIGHRLPGCWGADWERMSAEVTPAYPDRSARLITPRIALAHFNSPSASGLGVTSTRQLAQRTLQRGLKLNLPTAQGCLSILNTEFEMDLPVLAPEQLATGPAFTALERGGFLKATPLWYYILREAEILEYGERLGPLGSVILAETLAGVLIHDPASFWNQPGSDTGRWHPQDGVQPTGVPITSFRALLRSAGVL